MQLSAKNIHFEYSKGASVLSNVNFDVTSSEVVGLMAPSGRGKSTLAKILAGYEKPKSGEVVLDGAPLAPKAYNPVQLIFQHPEKAVNPLWKMKQVLSECNHEDPDLMEAMGISNKWLDRWPSELSGGELQRFCVLRVLNPKTKFIIADEITTMLDPITQAQIWGVVTQYAKANGIGLVVISHEKALLQRICHRIEVLY